MAGSRLQGLVTVPGRSSRAAQPSVIVTQGASVISESRVSANGTFDVEIPEKTALTVTIIGEGRVIRRSFRATRGTRIDLGEVELPFLEFSAGIDGQAWDALEDRAVLDGVARLLDQGRDVIASRQLESDGWFTFELTRKTLLTPGVYHVVIEAPGYERVEIEVEVTDDVTSYRLGRIDLMRTGSDSG
jgi:hypothetical protein